MNGKDAGEERITVRVPDLFELGLGGAYRLTGQTNTHTVNHYGTSSTVVNTSYMANDFYEQFSATLGINDMSLKLGGLFDICGTWNPADTCSNAPNGGHSSHRKGTGVDIDRCAQSTTPNNPNPRSGCNSGWIKVDKDTIEDLCWKNGKGNLAPEATIHCEFPK